ncbi:MAG: hypothetical protein K0U16_07545 [Gammaproteobacteria bacterium]|nr:hypothetical protein [Gammaproteobacteria bacterium]
MPTVAEIFDDMLQRYQHAATMPCFTCEGEGHVVDYDSPSETTWQNVFSDDGLVGKVSSTQFPVSTCKHCSGSGTIQPLPYHERVLAPILSEVIYFVLSARADENFGTMNAALDWAETFLSRCRQVMLHDKDAMEQLPAVVEKILEGPPPTKQTTELRGALSQDDLRELGIVEQDDSE